MESNELMEFLGYDPEISIDDFKSSFNNDYGRRDDLLKDKEFVQKVTGKALGSITTKIATMFKENGVELDKETVDKNPIEAVAKIGLAKMLSSHSEKLESIKADGSKNVDKRVAELNDKLTKLSDEKSQIESMLESNKSDFEKFKSDKDSEINGIYYQSKFNNEFGQFKFRPDASPIEIKGFKTEFAERYKTEYNRESDELIVMDKDGKRIPNPKQASTFKSFSEALNDLGDELKMKDNNENSRKKPIFTQPANNPPQPNENGKEGLTGDGRFRVRRTSTAE